jgi:hypothetical protein
MALNNKDLKSKRNTYNGSIRILSKEKKRSFSSLNLLGKKTQLKLDANILLYVTLDLDKDAKLFMNVSHNDLIKIYENYKSNSPITLSTNFIMKDCLLQIEGVKNIKKYICIHDKKNNFSSVPIVSDIKHINLVNECIKFLNYVDTYYNLTY